MRRRPRLLAGNDRHRTPRAMQGTTHMRSIVRVWAWVHPVLIGCAMKNTARLFNCASCHQQVVLCRHCDHGNIYCSRSCSDRVRRRSQRHAGQRYQNSRRGRHKHAERQRRYRERRRRRTPVNRRRGQEVTHHPLTAARRRPVVARTPAGRPGTRPFGHERPARVFRCDRCGRFCGQAVYPGLRPTGKGVR